MAFTQETFAPVGANSTNAPATYSYRSNDSLASIQATGYFQPKIFQLNDGDIVLVSASDGYGVGGVQSDQETLVIGLQAQDSPFCAPVTLSLVSPGAAQTVNINGLDVETTSLGNSGVQDILDPGISFTSTTKNVHFETQMTFSSNGSTTFHALVFSDATFAVPYVSLVYLPGSNVLLDSISGMPLAGVPPAFTPGYTLGVFLDSATGTALAVDNGVISEAITVDPAYNNGLTIYPATSTNAGSTVGERFDYTVNYGSSAFITSPEGDRHCD